jgi:hypothetical protein
MGANASSASGGDFLSFCEPKPMMAQMLEAVDQEEGEEEEDYLENPAEYSDYVMPLEYLDYYWQPQKSRTSHANDDNLAELVVLDSDLVLRLIEHSRLGEPSHNQHFLLTFSFFRSCLFLYGYTTHRIKDVSALRE